MLKKIVHKISYTRHPWRKLEFDELAEMYASMTIRKLGLSMIGFFVPVFLYKSGSSLQDVFLFITYFFIFRALLIYPIAKMVGRIGPKHSIAMSTVGMTIFLIMLLMYSQVRWQLPLLAFVYTATSGLFFLAFHTDFSKIKHKKHGGKELGWMSIFQSMGGVIGPLLGGVIASIYSPSWTFVIAIFVLCGSLYPLFLTNEAVKVHQKISLKGFNPFIHSRDFLAVSSIHLVHLVSFWVWPLFLSVFIFTDDSYAKIGGLIALATFISASSAYVFGKFIDRQKGAYLLRWGVLMNSIGNFLRLTVTTGGGALALGVLNEPSVLSLEMPLVKGFYDNADLQKGHRIVYLAWSELVGALLKATFSLIIFIALHHYDPLTVLRGGFILVGLITPIALTQRFPALKRV